MTRNFLICCAALLLVVVVSILPACGLIFQCGCTLREGATHCNVHKPGVPHCPWCSHGTGYFVGSIAAILAGTFGTIYGAMRLLRPTIAIGLLAGVVGYVLWASIVGFAAALADGYPTWYGWNL